MSSIDPDRIDISTNRLHPVADQVVVELEELPTTTESGLIHLPADSRKFDYVFARVIAVGPGARTRKNGALIPMELKVGDRVVLGRYIGADFEFGGKKYRIMKEENIYAVVEE